MRIERVLAMLALVGVSVGCGQAPQGGSATSAAAESGFAAELRTRLLDAKPGDVIEVPAGTFSFDRSLNLRVDNVTLRGAGQDKSILKLQGPEERRRGPAGERERLHHREHRDRGQQG